VVRQVLSPVACPTSSATRPSDLLSGMGAPSNGGTSRRPLRGRHNAGASSFRLRRPCGGSLGDEPGQQHGIGEADLASEVHDRGLSGAQELGKRLRAHAQPPPGFGQGDELGWCGEVEGESQLGRRRL
jgi:hypothetical protein